MIISGIFTGLINTKFGGRPPYFNQRYYQGLSYLGGNTQQKIVYVKPEDLDKVKEVLSHKLTEEEYQRYTLIPFNLEDQIFNEKLLKVREKEGFPYDRCPQVQYGKFEWMSNHIDEDEYIWWVDAGLICDHLFPTKYMSNPEEIKKILNDEFFENLKSRVGTKNYFICGDRHRVYQHGKPNIKYFKQNYQDRYHTIGGFFGGYSKTFKNFINDFNVKADEILNDVVLYSEETIMEIIFSEQIDNCYYDDFTTWRHESSPDYRNGTDNFRLEFDQKHKPFYCNFFESEICRNSKICN